VFAAAIGLTVARGRTEIACGCFRGDASRRIGWPLVVRNLILAGLALVAALPARPGIGAFAQGAGAGGSLFVMLLTLGTLPGARRRARTT